jgi:hypothetical protein
MRAGGGGLLVCNVGVASIVYKKEKLTLVHKR